MSAFHRVPVGAARELPGPVYFMLAARLGAYAGVIQAINIQRQQDGQDGHEGRHPTPSGSSSMPGSNEHAQVSDTFMLEKLASEGWVERG